MLSQYMKPIQGDSAGNDLKWDSLVLEAELYLKTGNYALLRDVRHRQARFVELEGNTRIAAAYYLMVFYGDLNGFRNAEEIISANRNGFSGWKSSAMVDPGIINKISAIIHDCAISDSELEEFFRKAFIPEFINATFSPSRSAKRSWRLPGMEKSAPSIPGLPTLRAG